MNLYLKAYHWALYIKKIHRVKGYNFWCKTWNWKRLLGLVIGNKHKPLVWHSFTWPPIPTIASQLGVFSRKRFLYLFWCRTSMLNQASWFSFGRSIFTFLLQNVLWSLSSLTDPTHTKPALWHPSSRAEGSFRCCQHLLAFQNDLGGQIHWRCQWHSDFLPKHGMETGELKRVDD